LFDVNRSTFDEDMYKKLALSFPISDLDL